MRSCTLSKSMKMPKPRLKIYWLSVIMAHHKADSFVVYRRFHWKIGINRAARAFVLKNKLFFDPAQFMVGGKHDSICIAQENLLRSALGEKLL